MTVAREREGERTRPPRFTDDGGAVLAEAALITPIFIFLLFGILELGGLFNDYLTMNNATLNGARAASIAGNQFDADYKVLQAIKKESQAMPSSNIEHIVIYHPASPTEPATSDCRAGLASAGSGETNWTDACNTYVGADLEAAAEAFGCESTDKDRYWCPTSRKTAASGPMSPPDYLGVWIQVRHPWVTGLFGSSITVDNASVVKLEPRALRG